jgi:hypothetical protein
MAQRHHPSLPAEQTRPSCFYSKSCNTNITDKIADIPQDGSMMAQSWRIAANKML